MQSQNAIDLTLPVVSGPKDSWTKDIVRLPEEMSFFELGFYIGTELDKINIEKDNLESCKVVDPTAKQEYNNRMNRLRFLVGVAKKMKVEELSIQKVQARRLLINEAINSNRQL